MLEHELYVKFRVSGVFYGFHEEPPGGEALYRQATQACNPVLGFSDEVHGGDEHP